jgi:hypothetical protein
MFKKKRFCDAQPVVWVRNGRGGPGYEDRAVGRVVRAGTGRISVFVFRADDQAWVIRSVGASELEPANESDLARLESLEQHDCRKAA